METQGVSLRERNSNLPKGNKKDPPILVAIDFSHCSQRALAKAKSLASREHRRILALHVIDEGFVKRCIRQKLGTEKEIKSQLYQDAKAKLAGLLQREGLGEKDATMMVCEGMPCIEINKKAVENEAEMIVIGSKGNSDDMRGIFFGSTTERVLRFIKRPVLCVPPDWDYRL
jgi:nucleotide-binding universal stress UspA family protein